MKKFMESLEHLLELGGTRRDILFLVISGIALVLSLIDAVSLPFDIAWVAIILCGVPIVLKAIIGLVTAFDIKADVLVSLALIASVIIGEDFAAGEVAFIMQIGGLLEELTVAKARAGIERLVHLTPRTARVLKDGKETIIPAEQVTVGDILRVLPGETVPVDGVILSGQTSIDQAVMTGESMPVDKTVGDEVSSGTVNQFGAFEMEASKVGEDSSIQRMIRLVQSADAGKAKIVGIADRWATWIVVIALTSAALVLATPTAIMAAIGNATKHGFLVGVGDALERLAGVKLVAFDKTGTLTYGTPEVVAVKSLLPEYSDTELYGLAAAGEQRSEHPLGKAILRSYCKDNGDVPAEAEDFSMLPGRGISAVIGGKVLLAGNKELLAEKGVAPQQDEDALESLQKQGCTITYLALDGVFAGYIALSDTVRAESKGMIKELSALGVKPVLLTGDHENAAKTIGRRLGIHEIHWECRPETKMEMIDGYQQKQQPVCMIGDGINDAPALKKAAVGIAMGGVGSDIAVDAADIALVNDDVKELPHLIALSYRMMTTIKVNMSFSMGLNFIAIILAMTGVLNPVVGALVHKCGSVLVIINSARLLR